MPLAQFAGLSALAEWNSPQGLTTGPGTVSFQLSGSIEALVDYVAALAWLAAALRRSSCEETQMSTVSFEKAESLVGTEFRITLKALMADGKEQVLCWHDLFRHTVVAFGFEVASRQSGVGLELVLDLMVELAENAKPFNYAGKFFMIGSHSALIPTALLGDHSMQWHLFKSPDRNGLSLQDLPEISALSVPETYTNDVDMKRFFQRLQYRRHFCGWSRSARITLGTCPQKGGKYTVRGFTNAPEISREAKLTSFNAGIASSGLGFAGPSISGTWNIASARKQFSETPVQRFETILFRARRTPSILYDPEERRAWMVPLICVLYHMAHLRAKLYGHNISLPYVDSSWDGASVVYDAIVSNRQLKIGSQDEQSPFLLSDLLEQLWLDLQLVKVKQPGRRTWLWKDSLYGCELMDIVNGVPPLRLKKTYVRNSGGWIKLMREIDVVLFGSGVGEVIAPKDPGADTCRLWSSVPKGQDFLCVTIDCLQRLSERAGSSPECEALAHGCFWHSPKPLFSPCNCCGHESCNPLQQVVEFKTWDILGPKNLQPPCNISDEGAVIFGEMDKSFSLNEVVQPQVVKSGSEPEISEQRSCHVHLSTGPSFMDNRYTVPELQEQPRLRRRVKRENLRFSTGEPIDARQYQTGSREP